MVAESQDSETWECSDYNARNIKLSRAFISLVVLHIVAVVGILAFEVLKPRQNELDEAPERTPGLLGKHFLDAIASDQSILNNPARLEALLDAASVPEDSSAILWYDSWGEVQIPVTRAKALENAELAEEVLLDRAKQIEVPRTR